MQPFLRAFIHFQIVMPNDRGGRVNHTVVHRGARCQLVGGTNEAVNVAFDNGFIGGKRDERAQLLDRPFDHDVGEVEGVVAVLVQDRFGFVGGSYEEYTAYYCRDDLPPGMWDFVSSADVKAISGFAVVP